MKFSNKKFNIKKLIKVSAVALAMISAGGIISTVNANTNVHADQFMDAAVQANKKADAISHAQDIKYLRTHPNDRADIELMDPLDKSSLNQIYAKGYKVGNTKDQQEDFKNVSSDNGVKKANQMLHTHFTSSSMPTDSLASNRPTKKQHEHNYNTKKNTPKHVKRTHLSKAMIRKIMNQMNADKRAIRNDKKHLSTRNAKRFMRNYTKASKSVKRAKREQKRAMATKGAKRYLHYYKDEVKHEKDLVRLTKSTRVSKATKRNARKSLKRVRKNIRKNRKNVKRAHKVIRAHKHGRKARK